jgi:hypothetical protein
MYILFITNHYCVHSTCNQSLLCTFSSVNFQTSVFLDVLLAFYNNYEWILTSTCVLLFSTSSLFVCLDLLLGRLTSTYSYKLFSTFITSLLDYLLLELILVIVIYLVYLLKHSDLLDVGIIYWTRFLSIFVLVQWIYVTWYIELSILYLQ